MRRAWNFIRSSSRRVGPYLLLEVVMPGGTLLALMLYLYRSALSSRTRQYGNDPGSTYFFGANASFIALASNPGVACPPLA